MLMNELVESKEVRRTRPWMDDEYMLVDGFKAVYTVDHKTGAILVRMPGRITESPHSLQAQGRRVTMPKILRTNDFA